MPLGSQWTWEGLGSVLGRGRFKAESWAGWEQGTAEERHGKGPRNGYSSMILLPSF